MRLEVHIPNEMWERIEKHRGEVTRSEWARRALEAYMRDAPNWSYMPQEKPVMRPPYGPHAPSKSARELLAERTKQMRSQ